MGRTTDPGRALISGAWKDVGRVKGPILHGLSSRAPYFHNGSARSLDDVVDFYDKRFNIGFSSQEKEDLIAFLSALQALPRIAARVLLNFSCSPGRAKAGEVVAA
jgi:cytochrome c peroxidase